jgi:DNA (cytosine-5)-methyltransferase 1
MLRVITELGPRWVVGENVPGILRIAAADVVADLERLGYHVVVCAFEAAAVGAYHRRERVAFVAHSDGGTVWNDGPDKRKTVGKEHSSEHASHDGGAQDVGNTEMRRLTGEQSGRACAWRPCSTGGWPAEPDVGRVAHGIPNRVDRLKCLGNAVVPAQFYPIFKAIMEEEHA